MYVLVRLCLRTYTLRCVWRLGRREMESGGLGGDIGEELVGEVNLRQRHASEDRPSHSRTFLELIWVGDNSHPY
jgi:hypothetical protein